MPEIKINYQIKKMINLFQILILTVATFIHLSVFALGGKACRNFENKTETYFELFYKSQDQDGVAKCNTNSDCILSARGLCNRQELASKITLTKNELRRLNKATKAYVKLFDECAVEVCTKTRQAATGTKCSQGRCEFTYE